MPDRDRTLREHVPQRIERKCTVCGEDLPAGVVFHVDKGCAKIHRDQVHRERRGY